MFLEKKTKDLEVEGVLQILVFSILWVQLVLVTLCWSRAGVALSIVVVSALFLSWNYPQHGMELWGVASKKAEFILVQKKNIVGVGKDTTCGVHLLAKGEKKPHQLYITQVGPKRTHDKIAHHQIN